MNRRVLITGGTGFVGSHAIDYYAKAGWTVQALVRNPSRRAWDPQFHVDVHVGSVERYDSLQSALKGCELVVHCAGVTKTPRPAEYYRVNRDAVGMITRAAREAGVRRFILCSSQAASGPAQDGIASIERDTPHPLTDYGRSKLAGEQQLRDNAGDMEWIVLRPPSILGPRDAQFVPLFRAVARWGIYPQFGKAGREYSYVYVKDFARALLAAGEAGNGLNDTYFVSHPQPLDWTVAATTIATLAGRRVRALPVPESVLRGAGKLNDWYAAISGRPALLSSDKVKEILAWPWICSSEKIQKTWNFECKYSTEQALGETLDFYRSTGHI